MGLVRGNNGIIGQRERRDMGEEVTREKKNEEIGERWSDRREEKVLRPNEWIG